MKSALNLKAIFIEYSAVLTRGKLVVLFNGFQKKTQKTPKKEIDLALRLKDEYFNSKKK
jgi:phage-related protein